MKNSPKVNLVPGLARDVTQLLLKDLSVNGNVNLSIYDATGRYVSNSVQITFFGNAYQLGTQMLSSGVYSVIVNSNGEIIGQLKLVIQ